MTFTWLNISFGIMFGLGMIAIIHQIFTERHIATILWISCSMIWVANTITWQHRAVKYESYKSQLTELQRHHSTNSYDNEINKMILDRINKEK